MRLIPKIHLGISLKLFLAFWLVILSSGFLTYIITLQFKHTPHQELANPKQLVLLNQFSNQLSSKFNNHSRLNVQKNVKSDLKKVRSWFLRKYNQHLFIKDLSNNKVYSPRSRAWHRVSNYLKNNALPNPTTIDFSYSKITGAKNITLYGKDYQLFIASPIDRQKITSIIDQLPLPLRVISMLVISFLLCWLLAKAFSKPLIAIQKASDALGKGDLTTRLTGFERRSDEFGAVAKSFNKMASQLEGNISAHQRLLGDVSHELRSPLARLQLAIGLAEKNMENPTEQQRHLSRCEHEVDRLDDMIADVLTLSRLEHANTGLNFQQIKLTNLIQKIIDDCQYIANAKQVKISLEAKQQHSLFADEKLLVSAVSNVINNAVKYTPKNTDITVSLSSNQQKITLVVTDQGEGVPAEMLSQLFMPFFRVADGRERSSGGTGLGLAIARQAIQQHQGEISAKNSKPNGLQVIITLPVSQTQG
jgi:two-component system sensor histidine kinase CpxA